MGVLESFSVQQMYVEKMARKVLGDNKELAEVKVEKEGCGINTKHSLMKLKAMLNGLFVVMGLRPG